MPAENDTAVLAAGLAPAFDAALARYRSGSPMAAAVLFDAILAHLPDHASARRLRGLSLVRAGRAAAALSDLRRARLLAPDDPLSHLHYGIGLQEAGRPVRAAALFRRATVMMPDSAAPWINFASALHALGEMRAARAAARRAVALAPDDADAVYMLGLAELGAGDVDDAQGAFAAAIKLRPGFAPAWNNLVLALTRSGEIDLALRAIGRGRAACPDDGSLAAASAAFAVLAGDHDEALALLRDVLERDPGCVAARLNLANALLLDGEGRAALALLEGPAPGGRNGAHWRAHRALALLQIGRVAEAARDLDAIAEPYGDAEILVLWRRIRLAAHAGRAEEATALAERMSRLADTEGASLFEHRVIAHFDLARFRDEHGEAGAAFAHWRAGHRLLARLQPFSRTAHEAFVATVLTEYDARRLRDGPAADVADDAPVFIVGLPRSGTTLAEHIIAAHRLVHGGGERHGVHHAFLRLSGRPANRADAVRAAAARDAATLTREAAALAAEMRALSPDARLVTDKLPGNALHLGFIATLLPRAKVIICRRDPRDVGLSIFQHRFFGHHPYAHDLADLGWYIGQHERLMDHWRAVLPLAHMTLDLSNWVDDFDATLARVLGFLGLPHDASCERFFEQKRRVRTASAQQVRQPVNARGIGRWRGYAAELAPMLTELEAAGCIETAS